MPVPDHATRFWRALDACFGRVQPTWWGAVVTDDRYPVIWDANYARIDDAGEDLRAADIEDELLPALAAAGTDVMHVVSFDPEARAVARRALDAGRPARVRPGDGPGRPVRGRATGVAVEEPSAGDELWDRVAASMALFGVERRTAVEQLRDIERDVMAPAGKRWFGVRDAGGTLVRARGPARARRGGLPRQRRDVPRARGQGLASAITTRIVREADLPVPGRLAARRSRRRHDRGDVRTAGVPRRGASRRDARPGAGARRPD